MILYIGGAGHGQEEICERETGFLPLALTPEEALRAKAIASFHLLTKRILEEGGKPQEFARQLVNENPEAIICTDEIGSGIHPMDHAERVWREETGRALCILAAHAQKVSRVCCGIAQRIK